MALSPTTAWREAMQRSDRETRLLVEIYDGTNTFKALNGSVISTSDLSSLSIPVSILSMTQLGVQLDPLTRESQIKAIELTVLDDWIRPIVVNYQLARKRLKVFLGDAILDEADFLSVFVGEIDEILPGQGDDEHSATIFCTDLISSLKRVFITGFWASYHPTEALHNSLLSDGILDKAGIVDFDEDSFDRTQDQYADIENAIISRTGLNYGSLNVAKRDKSKDRSVKTPTRASDLAAEVCKIMYAHLDFEETGSIRCVRYNPSLPNLDTWSYGDDIIPGTFRQVSSGKDNIINRVVWNFGDPQVTYRADDTQSQSDYAFPGTSERIETHEIETNWLDDFTHVNENLDTTETGIMFYGGGFFAMSGNRNDMTVDSDSPVYLLIRGLVVDLYPGENTQELVKCEAVTRDTAKYGTTEIWLPDGGSNGTYYQFTASSLAGEYSSITRNWPDGPPGKEHVGVLFNKFVTIAYDATLPVIISDIILKRFKDGAAIIEFDTGIDKFEYQIGDFIGVEIDRYMAYGSDGLLSSAKQEIIGKEVSDDLQTIHWTLVAVNNDVPTRTGKVPFRANRASLFDLQNLLNQSIAVAYRVSGLVPTKTSGLDGSISPGRAVNGSRSALLGNAKDIIFTASRDTYLSIDMETSLIVVNELSNGAGAPTIPTNELFLGKVVTDGTEITSIDTSDVPTLPIPGSFLNHGSGPLAQLDGSGHYDLAGTHQNTLAGSSLAAGSGPLAQLNSSGQYDLGGTHQNTLPANTGVTPGSVSHYTWNRGIPTGGTALNGNRFGSGRTRVP